MDLPTCLYETDGERYLPTALTCGPWDPGAQHAGPPAALLARAIEQASQIHPGQSARLSFDILGPVPVAPLTVTSQVLRPGRRVEQVAATLHAEDGRDVMRATAWRLRDDAVDPLGTPPDPPPGTPEQAAPFGRPNWWRDEIGYVDALQWRFASEGTFDTAGPATAWARLEVPFVGDEPASPLERLLVMADAASGISMVLDSSAWLFINVELGIHLQRPPEGEWMAMDATTRLGPRGAGLTTATLFDIHGRVGISTQSLLIARR